MTLLVALAVLVAAVTHASWNAIAHTIKDQMVAFTLIAGGGTVIGAVLACFTPLPAAAAWPCLIASALLHIGYQALLMRSFSLGDFGQMYPIARGTAPLVVTVLAVLFVGESLSAWQLAGVVIASAGLVGVALWGMKGSGARPHWPALLAALATGLSIAAYTVVDGVGVRASGTPLGYIAWLMILEGTAIPAYTFYVHRGALSARLRPYAARGLLGAALSVAAYGLVLWAQTRAPLAPVAALRESSIIVGAAIGALFFKERFGGPRIAAAGLMVVGIGLMLRAS
ncbi:EamA-like transporter family protein [Streptomyces sp. SLBN-118]|uniref:DMT family transporter n=1 Tax=Streptomyces sp. SLBN-118 TaxID=2768454 RepID=UPI001154C3FA|nr:DMT family transporter [Streptomyces sp. SLBN-118]TQK45086.1 EamA-like transporter family protein [Streptomyces sp. SLBN-118]